MAELKIADVILEQRRKRNMTQEELAAALGVTSQSVSKWERGGYPDITLLPGIANYFGITVDELIGNDEASVKADIEDFKQRYGNRHDNPESLRLAVEYYRKYPNNFDIMELVAFAVYYNRDTREENYPLLKEVCERIVNECTWEYPRMNAISFMCVTCPDEEWDKWREMCARDYESYEGERLENRYLGRGRREEFYGQRNKNDLMIFMHYLARNDPNYWNEDSDAVFAEPERAAAWEAHKIRLLDTLESELPQAWLGYYGEAHLKAAAALIGCGRPDEGFAYLDKAFTLFEQWNRIPDKCPMKLGCADVWGEAAIMKNDSYIRYADGSELWTPYLWMFWQIPADPLNALTRWPWFDAVKEDPRYTDAVTRAKIMAENG